MFKRKRLFLTFVVLLSLTLSSLATLAYLWFIKIPELNQNITLLNSKLDTLSQDTKTKDDQNKALQADLANINKSKSDLENKVKVNEAALNKQQACTKANELSQVPVELTLRTSGESGGNGCGSSSTSFIPSSTQGALNYLQGFLKNYKDTSMQVWQHSPDVCLYDAQKAFPILEARYTDYQKYKNICGS